MRMLYIAIAALIGLSLIGCGGGGGVSTITPTASLSVPDGAAPEGVTPTLTYKSKDELFADEGQVPIFVSGAQCAPAGTTFSSPVTLTFGLSQALASGTKLGLFEKAANGNWPGVPNTTVTLSPDGLTATVQVSKFSDLGYYAILKLK